MGLLRESRRALFRSNDRRVDPAGGSPSLAYRVAGHPHPRHWDRGTVHVRCRSQWALDSVHSQIRKGWTGRAKLLLRGQAKASGTPISPAYRPLGGRHRVKPPARPGTLGGPGPPLARYCGGRSISEPVNANAGACWRRPRLRPPGRLASVPAPTRSPGLLPPPDPSAVRATPPPSADSCMQRSQPSASSTDTSAESRRLTVGDGRNSSGPDDRGEHRSTGPARCAWRRVIMYSELTQSAERAGGWISHGSATARCRPRTHPRGVFR